MKFRMTMVMCGFVVFVAGLGVAGDGAHLFILSGQSNMTGGLKGGFSKKVGEHFGKEQVVVVSQSKAGRGIRFWDKDYVFPENYVVPGKGRAPSEGSKAQHGMEYPVLLKAVEKAGDAEVFRTITFVWMQGESDAGRGLGGVYEQSFFRVLGRLKTDIGRDDVGFVIGRVSDAGLNGASAKGWREVRAVQAKLAKDAKDGTWIDTDDLNGPDNNVHYPKEKAGPLGARFADKAIELVSKRLAADVKK